jgi:hypothetical protein
MAGQREYGRHGAPSEALPLAAKAAAPPIVKQLKPNMRYSIRWPRTPTRFSPPTASLGATRRTTDFPSSSPLALRLARIDAAVLGLEKATWVVKQ